MSLNIKEHAELLKILGHPIRLKILWGLIHNKGCNVNKMAEKLSLPQSTVSQHLGLMRVNGIIYPEKNGVETCYKVDNKLVVDLINLLEGR